VTWLIRTCAMTHFYVWHDSFTYDTLTWRPCCKVARSLGHDSFLLWHDWLACSWLSDYHTYTAPMLRSGEIWAALVLKLPDDGRFTTVGIAFEGDQVLMCPYITKYGQKMVFELLHGHGFTGVYMCK